MSTVIQKERPILFRGEMVRALLDGRKTQTRRVVKPQPTCERLRWGCVGGQGFGFISNTDAGPDGDSKVFKCPYGQVGDQLWVREAFVLEETNQLSPGCIFRLLDEPGEFGDYLVPHYRATEPDCGLADPDGDDGESMKWKPSIHMPRWASRLSLEITDVRVERLQEISESDAKAEGVDITGIGHSPPQRKHQRAYAILWNKINGPGSWEANPWVWALTFKRIG